MPSHPDLKGDRSISIPVVLPGSWIAALNAVAEASGRSRSAVIREAIAMVVFGGRRHAAPLADMPDVKHTAGDE